MKLAGLEPIPGSEGVLNTVQEAREFAEHINYPVLLKASAGGGGKGMRLVEEEACLEAAFIEASMEAEKAFGNPALYMEKFITGGRHIEFQVLVDHFGNAVHLGERECSVQRHHQKLVEESPSQAISSETRQSLGEKVARVAAKIGYYNAGTVEFLMTPQGELYFMEMNTRLQVEHPVTEMVTGVDIVQEQIRIAANQPLALRQEDICFQGSAIEVRINAEDPFEDFRPSPGTVEIFKVPEKEGSIRLDTHVEEGYTIPPYYDSMICKLIAHAKTRPEAIELMLKTLDSFEIGGVKTTIPIHKKILDSDLFRGGEYNTTILDHI